MINIHNDNDLTEIKKLYEKAEYAIEYKTSNLNMISTLYSIADKRLLAYAEMNKISTSEAVSMINEL